MRWRRPQIAHVIREIRHFQQTPYKIEYNSRVAGYLLDPSLQLNDEDLYRLSLDLEPRRSTLTHVSGPLLAATTSSASSSSSSSWQRRRTVGEIWVSIWGPSPLEPCRGAINESRAEWWVRDTLSSAPHHATSHQAPSTVIIWAWAHPPHHHKQPTTRAANSSVPGTWHRASHAWALCWSYCAIGNPAIRKFIGQFFQRVCFFFYILKINPRYNKSSGVWTADSFSYLSSYGSQEKWLRFCVLRCIIFPFVWMFSFSQDLKN